jgi:hypothetical protein
MDARLGWTPEEGSAVTAVIIVMKMVISYTDRSRHEGGSELPTVQAQTAAEEANVLLNFAWHDTSEYTDEAAVLALQEKVYEELMAPGIQW